MTKRIMIKICDPKGTPERLVTLAEYKAHVAKRRALAQGLVDAWRAGCLPAGRNTKARVIQDFVAKAIFDTYVATGAYVDLRTLFVPADVTVPPKYIG